MAKNTPAVDRGAGGRFARETALPDANCHAGAERRKTICQSERMPRRKEFCRVQVID